MNISSSLSRRIACRNVFHASLPPEAFCSEFSGERELFRKNRRQLSMKRTTIEHVNRSHALEQRPRKIDILYKSTLFPFLSNEEQ